MTDEEAFLRRVFTDHEFIAPRAEGLAFRVRERAAQRRRQGLLRSAGSLVAVGAVTTAIVVGFNLINPATKPATSVPIEGTKTVQAFFINKHSIPNYDGPVLADNLVSETVNSPDTGDLALDAVNALFDNRSEQSNLVNGFNIFGEGGPLPSGPIADVNSVKVSENRITVDLSKSVWDPYPTVDMDAPPGRLVMQQLVWTLQTAINRSQPVALTINGVAARGIWFYRLNGPVQRDGTLVATEHGCLNPVVTTSKGDTAVPRDNNPPRLTTHVGEALSVASDGRCTSMFIRAPHSSDSKVVLGRGGDQKTLIARTSGTVKVSVEHGMCDGSLIQGCYGGLAVDGSVIVRVLPAKHVP